MPVSMPKLICSKWENNSSFAVPSFAVKDLKILNYNKAFSDCGVVVAVKDLKIFS